MRENLMSGWGRGSRKRGENHRACSLLHVCPGSCDGLAGESPAGVAAKRPRSWWPAEGEIRLSKRHDKVAVGGEQVVGPYARNPVTAS
jgi:hypothetical protein